MFALSECLHELQVAFVFCRNFGGAKDLVHQNATEESDRVRERGREGGASGRRHWIAKITAEEVAMLRCFANWPRNNGMKSAGDDEPPQQGEEGGLRQLRGMRGCEDSALIRRSAGLVEPTSNLFYQVVYGGRRDAVGRAKDGRGNGVRLVSVIDALPNNNGTSGLRCRLAGRVWD